MTLPEYLNDQTEDNILNRMLANVPQDLDKSEGSYIWDSLSPASIELVQAAQWAQEVLRRSFASTSFGDYLDLRCLEHGLSRRDAVKSSGQVTFSGVNGTTLPAGTRVATLADDNNSSKEFETSLEALINASGTVTVDITAIEAGIDGNVAAEKITILQDAISGIMQVINNEATSGGLDTESDDSLLSRYLQKVQNPSAGGNKADYVNWSLEVNGVGGVAVIPVRDGPGTVSIAIIDTDKQPAGQDLVDSVQDYISPPWIVQKEAEELTLFGNGISVDTSLEDDFVDSVKMIYDAAGQCNITDTDIQEILGKAGTWQVRPKIKVDNNTEATDLLIFGIWNLSTGTWAKPSSSGTEDACVTLKAEDLSTSFQSLQQDFYWNGIDQLELRITRLQSDATTTVWVDQVIYRSTFSKDTGEGKAPVGARVTVEAATPVIIDITAVLSITSGYNTESVKSLVEQNIDDYLKTLAFCDDNDVRYVRVGQVILDTPGVQDYSDLLVNNGTSNIPVSTQEVAVKGTVNLT